MLSALQAVPEPLFGPIGPGAMIAMVVGMTAVMLGSMWGLMAWAWTHRLA